MKKTLYKAALGNKKLTDYRDLKDAVVQHKVLMKLRTSSFQTKISEDRSLHIFING